MAHLFTVYFPRYCFELQEEFSISFPSANELPFTPDVNVQGGPHVRVLVFDQTKHSPEVIRQWIEGGLKVGLRILSINGEKLHTDDDMLSRENSMPMLLDHLSRAITRKDLEDKIRAYGKGPITFAFREDIPALEDSTPLGLSYIAPLPLSVADDIALNQAELLDSPAGAAKPNGAVPLQRNASRNDVIVEEYKIGYDSISVSSFDASKLLKHGPEYVRLNHPDGCWRPSDDNARSRDVWVCFDLGGSTLVDKIKIQGNIEHTAYVTSVWVEYSDDLCCWKSHSMRRVPLRYVPGRSAQKLLKAKCDKDQIPEEYKTSIGSLMDAAGSPPNGALDTPPPSSGPSSDCLSADDILDVSLNNLDYDTATIKLWPAITAEFIRLRPATWHNHIAMRIELLGNPRPRDHQQIGKIVTQHTVSPLYKPLLLQELVNKDANTIAIQIDCTAIVIKAMQLAGSSSYGIINVDELHCLLVATTANASMTERVMDQLTNVGVGRQIGVVTAVPAEWRNAAASVEAEEGSELDMQATTGFYASVKSSKQVKTIVERIMNAAALTFDYYCMLAVASMIAVGGLATNSAVIVVASMLVSPIMGPVLAFTFGVSIGNKHLARMGVVNEVVSLLGCLLVGFVVGFFYCLCTRNRQDWPTQEMSSRGDPWVLTDGAFIGFVSGIGVALSVLGDYMATVVGCAISASLLPPAVNCGMLFALCLYETINPECVAYPGCGNTPSVHNFDSGETMLMALVTLLLTIENIILIFVAAWIMFKIKDVVSTDDNNRKVWNNILQYKEHHTASIMAKHSAANLGHMVAEKRRRRPRRDREFNVVAKTGTEAKLALNQFEDEMDYGDRQVIHSTLKGATLRQASNLNFLYSKGSDGTGSEGQTFSENITKSDKEPPQKKRTIPHLTTIFSNMRVEGNDGENEPLMSAEEDDDCLVPMVVKDEED